MQQAPTAAQAIGRKIFSCSNKAVLFTRLFTQRFFGGTLASQ
jgi:hypothetical protein